MAFWIEFCSGFWGGSGGGVRGGGRNPGGGSKTGGGSEFSIPKPPKTVFREFFEKKTTRADLFPKNTPKIYRPPFSRPGPIFFKKVGKRASGKLENDPPKVEKNQGGDPWKNGVKQNAISFQKVKKVKKPPKTRKTPFLDQKNLQKELRSNWETQKTVKKPLFLSIFFGSPCSVALCRKKGVFGPHF